MGLGFELSNIVRIESYIGQFLSSEFSKNPPFIVLIIRLLLALGFGFFLPVVLSCLALAPLKRTIEADYFVVSFG